MTCMCDESQRVMSLNGDKVVCVCGGEGGGRGVGGGHPDP